MIKSFEEELATMKITALPTDLSPVTQTIENGIEEIKKILSAQPKSIIREFHFHLFPKINIKEYYQTYSKLILFIIIFALALALINFGDKWIEAYNQRQEELQQFQLNEKNKLSITDDDQGFMNQKPKKKSEFHASNTIKRVRTDSTRHYLQKHNINFTETSQN
ncbi:MAG TPA: hypothetical protein VK787_12085 [Puia sp.]|jgi:hypothetical protein|nr:hypothetical protein [Puia sp.]